MRKFKVSATLKSNIERILHRRMVPYSIGDGYCNVELSGEKFHKVVLRAKMERMQEEAGSTVPFIAEIEKQDPVVMQEVGTAYIVK